MTLTRTISVPQSVVVERKETLLVSAVDDDDVHGNPQRRPATAADIAWAAALLDDAGKAAVREAMGGTQADDDFGGFGTDPRDSAALLKLRQRIDACGWRSEEEELAANYEERVGQMSLAEGDLHSLATTGVDATLHVDDARFVRRWLREVTAALAAMTAERDEARKDADEQRRLYLTEREEGHIAIRRKDDRIAELAKERDEAERLTQTAQRIADEQRALAALSEATVQNWRNHAGGIASVMAERDAAVARAEALEGLRGVCLAERAQEKAPADSVPRTYMTWERASKARQDAVDALSARCGATHEDPTVRCARHEHHSSPHRGPLDGGVYEWSSASSKGEDVSFADDARRFALEHAEQFEAKARGIDIMRSVDATEGARWLREIAAAIREAAGPDAETAASGKEAT